MSVFTKFLSEIWRNYVTDGVPSSGPQMPVKADIRAWGTQAETAIEQLVAATCTNFRNIAGRNGGFEVWQLGTSVSVPASTTAYTVDGWYLTTGANQASAVAQGAALTPGSINSAAVFRNSGQTGTGTMRFAFPLSTEEQRKMRGKNVVLSFSVLAGANWSPASGTLNYTLYCGLSGTSKRNGSAYTSETTPISGSVNLTPGGSVTQVVSALSSVVGTGITSAEIQFSWAPTGTAGANDWFAIDDLQLEVVPSDVTAIPVFERTDFIFDLVRCQRHFEKSYDITVSPGTNVGTDSAGSSCFEVGGGLSSTTAAFRWGVDFAVPKRVTPTITLYSTDGTAARVRDRTSSSNASSVSAPGPGLRGFNISAAPTAGSTAIFFEAHWTADARI